MSYTAPTVASDPASATHTNTALTEVNAFLATNYSRAITALTVLRDHEKLVGGSTEILNEIDRQLAILGTAADTDPAVVANPATLAQTNAAAATMSSYVDVANSRIYGAFKNFHQWIRRSTGLISPRDTMNTALSAQASPAVQTAPTTASDPCSQADMNTVLASLTTLLDTCNTELANILISFRDDFRLRHGNQLLRDRLEASITALQS